MQISMIGTGYVGLIAGLGFAKLGHSVTCFDNNSEKINSLNANEMPFYEAQATGMLKRFRNKKIFFTASFDAAVNKVQVIFICTNLPTNSAGVADLLPIETILQKINQQTSRPLIVFKSTLPIGSHLKLSKQFPKLNLVTNPEFLSQGLAVENFLKPARIILGATAKKDIKLLTALYKPLTKKKSPLLVMDPTSAEITKHAANALLASRISFMNNISRVIDITGGNIDFVKKGLAADPRIGADFLNAGLGFGGSCLANNVASLKKIGKGSTEPFYLMEAIELTNAAQLNFVFEKVKNLIEKNNLTEVSVWGLAYKPGTDDVRESPALALVLKLVRLGLTVRAYDPQAMKHVNYAAVKLSETALAAVQGAGLLLLLTEWPEFSKINLKKLKSAMTTPLIFDARNMFKPEDMKKLGFNYHSVGRAL